jgi:hypothetical protein
LKPVAGQESKSNYVALADGARIPANVSSPPVAIGRIEPG